jgi:hypothetical protein
MELIHSEFETPFSTIPEIDFILVREFRVLILVRRQKQSKHEYSSQAEDVCLRLRFIFNHRRVRNKQEEIRAERIKTKISIKWKAIGKRRKQNKRYKNIRNKQRKKKYVSAFAILTEII